MAGISFKGSVVRHCLAYLWMFVIHINELDESSETKFLSLQMKLELEAEETMKGNET